LRCIAFSLVARHARRFLDGPLGFLRDTILGRWLVTVRVGWIVDSVNGRDGLLGGGLSWDEER
jgi:hypothetical protein